MPITNLDQVQAKDSPGFIGTVQGNVTGNVTGTVQQPVVAINADGAITTKNGTVVIIKATAGAYTIAAPVSGTDDGARLLIIANTAQAHTVTNATPGFNNGGAASDVATWTAGIGNLMELVAYQGVWLVVNLRNVTLA